ncbi:MAG TPA: hypothetical protein VFW93_03515 [Aquabacterium sp.]|uniref:hypothetical protein n=1 Tax=Aquabacterium sp. TaxID=1872578 RepID=UPI002E32AFBA|nr:hypothetical protein [Aquabacterium sp.]HEX5355259.1 hypothetical protein [Aquabacterium sp.]
MKFTPHFRVLTVAGLLTLSNAMAHAAPLNTWLTAGDVAQSSQLGNIDLSAPSYLLGTASLDVDDDAPLVAGALNLSGNNPLDNASLTGVIGVPGGLFDDVVNAHVSYEGSALFNTVNVQAGDTLSFDWRLFAQVNTGPMPVPDAAWLILDNSAIKLADVDSLSVMTGTWLDSGLQHVSHTFTQSGLVKIGFVVADMDSYDTSSVLAVQHIGLTPAIPEPEGLALALTGLLILGRLTSRSHQS